LAGRKKARHNRRKRRPRFLHNRSLPTIRANVRQVLVPVVVTDKKGHYVTGLKASDFQVIEDGTPEKIIAFSTTHDLSIASVDDPSPSPESSSPEPRPTPILRVDTPRRTYVICLDVLHSAFPNLLESVPR